jgi:hypothetical protein
MHALLNRSARCHRLVWPWITIALSSLVARGATPGSLAELLDFPAIPQMKSWTTHQASGYDRGGGFYDSGNFLRVEPGPRYILMDTRGPGVIDRMWFTYKGQWGAEKYDLLIYLDGAQEPVIETDLDELFLGTQAPFVAPLAGICGNPKHPGRYSNVPVGFTSSCRVELRPTGPPDSYNYRTNSFGETIPHIYYQITWRRLSPGTSVKPFTWALDSLEETALSDLTRVWNGAGAGNTPWASVPSHAVQVTELNVTVAPGEKRLLTEFLEPGTIFGLRLRAADPERLRLHFHWDDAADPAVSVDFGPFFGGGDRGAPSVDPRGLWLGSEDGTYYCYLPMPFHRSARLYASATGPEPVRVAGEIDHVPGAPGRDHGHLHVHRYDHPTPVLGEDYVVLDVLGRGHFAGLVMDRPGHMEGDDRFFVDGESDPSLHGTGTEDFFNFAWGLSHTGSLPLHGITVQPTGPAAYRFHLPAGIPFRESLRITWEHGHDLEHGPNLDQRRYSGVVFFYGSNSASHGSGIDNRDSRPKSRQSTKMRDIERQQVCHFVRVTNRYQSCVVHLFADDGQRPDYRLPQWKDVGRLRQQRKCRFKACGLRFGVRWRKPQTIERDRPRGDISELDQVLRRHVQHLAVTVQFEHGVSSDRVEHVSGIRQTSQNACV